MACAAGASAAAEGGRSRGPPAAGSSPGAPLTRGYCAAKAVRVTSSFGWLGKLSPRTALAMQLTFFGSWGLVLTVTPTARPFWTAAQMLTAMLLGTPQCEK